jgi:hypothetical protein
MRLIGLQSLMCRLDPRVIGFPAARAHIRFPHPGHASSNRPSPASCETGSFSRVRCSSSEFLRLSSRPLLSKRPVLPGFLPSSRRYQRCPLGAGALRLPLCSVLRLSQPLDGLRHLPALRAYCIPQPRPGFPVQGFLPAHRRTDSSPARAPLPFPSTHSPTSQLPRANGSTSRLCSVDRCVPKGR